MSDEKFTLCPFVIVVDSAEQYAFEFSRIPAGDGLIYNVHRTFLSLGRHPNSFGDYSIYGYEKQVAIERKSQSDAYGTILGFKEGRRQRFEDELANLSTIVACVVVECGFEQFLEEAPDTGQKSASENRKTLFRSIVSLQQDYPVPWFFADGRRFAEAYAFRFLERFWNKVHKKGTQRGNHIRGGAADLVKLSQTNRTVRERWGGTEVRHDFQPTLVGSDGRAIAPAGTAGGSSAAGGSGTAGRTVAPGTCGDRIVPGANGADADDELPF